MRIVLVLSAIAVALAGCSVYDDTTAEGPARLTYDGDINPAAGNHCPDVEFDDELEIMYRLANTRTAPLVASPVLTTKYGWPTVNACSAVIAQWLNEVR